MIASHPDQTLAALKESIEAWEKKTKARGTWALNIGPFSCPLCHLFFIGRTARNHCLGCPVHDRTGKRYCHGTPYEGVRVAKYGGDNVAARAAAAGEVEFLKSLLPEGSPDAQNKTQKT